MMRLLICKRYSSVNCISLQAILTAFLTAGLLHVDVL